MGIASKLGQGSSAGPQPSPSPSPSNFAQPSGMSPSAPPQGFAGGYGAPPNPGQQQYGNYNSPGLPNPYGQPGTNSSGMYPSFGTASQYPSMGAPQYPSVNFAGGPPGAPVGYNQQQGYNQQTPYGGAPQQGYQGHSTPSGFSLQEIRQKLGKMVDENKLHYFYPAHRLDSLAQEISRLDISGLGQRWKLSREINLDLVTLALYDIIIWADDSTSMRALDDGGRIEDLKAILGRVAEAATMFDRDGISIRFMNSRKEPDNLRTASDVTNAISKIEFDGYTPLGSGLETKCLIPFVITPARNHILKKPVLIITITDGEPTGPGEHRETTRNVILRAYGYLKTDREVAQCGVGAVAFMFAQVGKDQNATAFLNELDVDPQVGSMIDCVSDYEIEEEEYKKKNIQLTPEVYLVKLMVGAVDRSYDEADEG